MFPRGVEQVFVGVEGEMPKVKPASGLPTGR